MNQSISTEGFANPLSHTQGDADRIDEIIARFMATSAQTLYQTRSRVEVKVPRLSPLTIGLTLLVAVLSSASAVFLFTNGATPLQIVLSSIGEVFLFVMVAISGLMDLQGNHKRLVAKKIADELAKCHEMAASMVGLAKLRSQWNDSIFEFESNLSAIKDQIEHAGTDLAGKQGLLDGVSLKIENLQGEHNELLASLTKSKDEAALLSQQCELASGKLVSLEEQVLNKTVLLSETSGLVEAEKAGLSLLAQQRSAASVDVSALQAKQDEIAIATEDLTLQKLELEKTIAGLQAQSQQLGAVDELLSQRRMEHQAATEAYDALLQMHEATALELTAAQSQMDHFQSERLQLDGELQRVRMEITVAQQERSGVAASIAEQYAQNDELAQQSSLLLGEIADLRRLATRISEDNRAEERSQAILTSTLDCLRRKAIRYKRRIEQSKLSIDQFEIEIQEQSSCRRQIEQDLSELQAQVAFANDEVARLEPARAELVSIQQQQEQGTIALENQKRAIADGVAEIVRGQANLAQIIDRIAAMDAVMSADADALQREISALQVSKEASLVEAERVGQEVATLLSELEKLKNNRSDLIKENEQLNASKNAVEVQAEQLHCELDEIARQIAAQEGQRDQVAAEHATLVGQQTDIRQEICHLEQDLQSMRNQHAKLEQMRDESLKHCDELRTLASQIDQQNRISAAEHARMVEQHESINAELATARAESGRLQLKAVALRAQEVSLRGEIEVLNQSRERLDRQAAEVESLLVDLNGQAERLQESLRAKDAVRLQLLKLSEEKELLSFKVHEANVELVSVVERIETSNQIADELSMRIAKAEDEVKSRSEIIEKCQYEIDSKQSLCENLAAQIAENRKTLDATQEECQRLVAKADELQQMNKQLAVETQRLELDRQACQQIAESRTQAERQLVSIQQEIDDAEMKMSEMSSKMQLGRQQLERDEFDIERIMNEKSRLNDEVRDFQHKLNETTKRRNDMLAEVEAYAQRTESLRLTIGQLAHEVDRLDAVKREGELLRMRNIDLEGEIMSKQQTVGEVDETIESMQRQSAALADAVAQMEEKRIVSEECLHNLILQADVQQKSLSVAQERERSVEQAIANLDNAIADREGELHRLDQTIQASLSEKLLLASDLEQMKAAVVTWASQADDAKHSLAETESMRAEQSRLILSIEDEQLTLQQTRQCLQEVVDARDVAQRHLNAIEAEAEESRNAIVDIKHSAKTLTEQMQLLTNSKTLLEEELSRFEAALEAKQQEIATIESRDRLRQSIVTKELEESAQRLAETERRLAGAKESLRAQEENVSEALVVSKQWDAYNVSLRAKWDEMQEANSNLNKELQTIVAEKLRAEAELTDARRRASDSENQANNAKLQLAGIETEISAASDRQVAIESALAQLQARTQQSYEQISAQQRQIDTQAESMRSINDQIAEKKLKLSELVVAEGRLIERCAAMEELVRQAEVAKEAVVAPIDQRIAQRIAVNDAIPRNVESTAAAQEDLLQEIELLVESIDQPKSSGSPAKESIKDVVVIPQRITKRPIDSKQTPPDPWASVFE